MLSALKSFCLQQDTTKIFWIAYSGGLDSHVLLHLCYQLKQELNIQFQVIHVNHGISTHAQTWVQHCEQVCRHYQLNLFVHHLQVQATANIEEVARDARYACFAKHIKQGDVLLTAHQQDDQAETMLLQLLRGAGLKGLAAMPVTKPFGLGIHGRPLLSFSRAMIQAFAEEQQLQWIHDESNDNHQYARNYMRHQILPLLAKRWPAASDTIARSARHCAEAQTFIEECGRDILETLRGTRRDSLSVKKLLSYSPERQRHMLRHWIESRGFSLPNTKKLLSIQHDVLLAKWDSMPSVSWGNALVRRYRDDIFVLASVPDIALKNAYPWDLSQPLTLPGLGSLQTKPVKGGLKALTHVEVKFRKGGESVEMTNRGRQSLKNLFQEWGVLPWERAKLPLIMEGEKLIAVVGYYVDRAYLVGGNETGYEIVMIT